ncbi:PaaI family thioesterase [Marinobacterium sp. xm-d-564]|uniref:PaaI family thioesterase n=1 Tax=Marinobacterium sp. xm-d-564 TaxID=2497742 RepID=UPI001569F46B|nr:PaaI family thioesterase [Marinobacterium sp. xm-d-564]NRP59394.1 Thioesterase superfamily protein [Marinobacterium sp. xm-d-564]
MQLDEMRTFLAEQFPQGDRFGELVELEPGKATMVLAVGDDHLRPGGTVSGPTMMALADVAVYAALLSVIGPVSLAVTTNLNINFLRKPKADANIVALAEMLKVGKRLAVGEVTIVSEGETDPVAHATMTYAIPV